MRRAVAILTAWAVLFPTGLAAAPVEAEHAVGLAARLTAHGRAARTARPSRTLRPQAAPTGQVRTFSEGGTNLFHLVELDGGGFVAVAAEDSAASPVMGFSPSGELPSTLDGPLAALLFSDGAARRGLPHRRRHGRRASALACASAARSAARPLTAAATSPVTSDSAIDDMRVAPLLQSKWDQKTVGGKNVYNYYTPHNWYCGCVATAMAQLMRFHKYPTASITAMEFPCFTNSVLVQLKMKGGTYAWDSMPLVPTSSITDAEREAIGKICYDAGVAMRMGYGSNGSGAYGEGIALVLKDVFGFANAQYAYTENASDFAAAVQDAILTNLDAGCPVLLGVVSDANAGHAIVADGYGSCDGTLFCHLNMGWSGAWDYWYALPSIPTGSYNFTAVDGIVYNIFPETTGEIASGRVADPSGAAVAGATVTATAVYRKASTGQSGGRPGWGGGPTQKYTYVTNIVSTVTDKCGIYAIFAPAGVANTVSVVASFSGWTASSLSTNVLASVSPSGLHFDDAGELKATSWTTSIGSRWGNDIVMGSYAGGDAAVSSFRPATGAAGASARAWTLSFTGTPGAWYRIERSETLPAETWTLVEDVLIPAAGAIDFAFTADGAADAMFYRTTPVSQ